MRSHRIRRELAAEIEAHIAERSDDLMDGGMPEAEAHRQARREFGNPTLYAEIGGEAWGWSWLDRIGKDLRYALRALRASPMFTMTAVLSLALGIGANTAIFTLLYATLWKPLPVTAPGQLFQLWRHAESGPWTGDFGSSYVLFQQLSQAGRDVGEVFATSAVQSQKFQAEGASSERISSQSVSANFFSVLGVGPYLGRPFEPPDDSVLGGRPVAILSHTFWQRRFQSDPAVLGKTILFNEAPYTVVGVAQPGFTGIEAEANIDVWTPVTSSVDKRWLTEPNVNWLRPLVRLRPDVTPARAESLFEKTLRLHIKDTLLPDADAHWRPVLEAQHITLRPAAAGLATTGHKYEKALLLLMALVGLVLLIACGNVANLILARNRARRHEIAIRRALGASRWRIASQLFSESLLLAAAGVACGLALADWGTRVLISFLPQPEVPLAFDLRPGLAVLSFAAAVGVATALLFGLVPAWRAGRGGADLTMRTTPRVTRGAPSGRLLVTGQLALLLVLLIGAGLFVATLRNLKTADLGFHPENVVTFGLSFPKGATEEHLRQTYTQIKERLESQPGVVVASYSWPGIYGRGGWSGSVGVEGHPATPGEDNEIGMIGAGPGFFEAIGMRLLEGRYLNAADQGDKPPVAVVNETFARHYFGAGPAIGRRITLTGMPKFEREIVGVVRDARHYGVRENPWRMVYKPAWKVEGGTFFVRTYAGVGPLSGAVRTTVGSIDKTAQIEGIRSLETDVDDMISQERLTATLAALFGALAMLLAGVGLYGVVAHNVSCRTNEFGIRMALGAQPGDVQRLVLGQTVALVVVGVTVGLAVAVTLVRFLSKVIAAMLYGVGPADGLIFGGAALLLAAIALLAAFLPARRASRIQPMIALRYE